MTNSYTLLQSLQELLMIHQEKQGVVNRLINVRVKECEGKRYFRLCGSE